MTQAWYPFYWSDYSGKTMHLTMGQHGAYMLFLRWIYTSGKPIPAKQCFSIARAMTEQEQGDATYVLEQFFVRKGDFWHSLRAEEVIKETRERHERRVNAGKIGGKAKAIAQKNNPSNATAMLKQSSSNALVTTTTTTTKDNIKINTSLTSQDKYKLDLAQDITPAKNKKNMAAKPDEIPDGLWQDFLTVRERKKAPLTKTALEGIEREAMRANITLERALSECCARGWAGFKAEWYERDKPALSRNMQKLRELHDEGF